MRGNTKVGQGEKASEEKAQCTLDPEDARNASKLNNKLREENPTATSGTTN